MSWSAKLKIEVEKQQKSERTKWKECSPCVEVENPGQGPTQTVHNPSRENNIRNVPNTTSGFYTSTHELLSFRFVLSFRRCLSTLIFTFLIHDIHFYFLSSAMNFSPGHGKGGWLDAWIDLRSQDLWLFSMTKFCSRHHIFRNRFHDWHDLIPYMFPPVPMTSIVGILTSRSACGFLLHIVCSSFKRGHPRVVSFSSVSFSELRSLFRYWRFFRNYDN